MKNIVLFLFIICINFSFGQSFEGQITYKTTVENPNPELVSDSIFKEKILKPVFGERGYMLQKYFYKGNRFMSEISTGLEDGFEVYDPEQNKTYAWKTGSKEVVVRKTDKHSEMDAFVEFINTKEIDTILNIPCKKVLLKSKMGTTELWFNEDYLKVNYEDYSDYKLEHKNIIFQTYGCLPFRAKTLNFTIEIVEFNEESVSEDQFVIPEFDTIIEQ